MLALFIGINPKAFAQQDSEQASEEVMQTTATQAEDTTEETVAPKDRSSGREARISAYKEKIASKMAESKSKRISSRCEAAQEKITALRTRVNEAVTKRQQKYDLIAEKLDELTAKLIEAGVDTSPLETAREDVRADLAVLAESMASYDTVLADLIEMDCASDPQTFNAALESARETQKALREQAQEFRRFALNELRTVIQELKAELESAKTTEGDQ